MPEIIYNQFYRVTNPITETEKFYLTGRRVKIVRFCDEDYSIFHVVVEDEDGVRWHVCKDALTPTDN